MRNLLTKAYWHVVLVVMAIAWLGPTASAQTMILKPPTVQDTDGSYDVKLLLKQDKAFRLEWTNFDASALNLSGANAKLVIGRASNTYQTLALDVTGTNGDFVPNVVGLSVGRYYARITNSTARTAGAIQEDATNNPGSILYSNEIQIIIEADEAP